MSKKPETVFKERALKDLATIPGAWFFKTQEVARRGIPDIILCLDGLFIGIELKIDGEKLEPLQEYNLMRIEECGGKSFTAYPNNWKQIFGRLKLMVKKRRN